VVMLDRFTGQSIYGAHPLSDGQKNQENKRGLAEGVVGVKIESQLVFHTFCGHFRSTGSAITASHQTAVWPTDYN
jgi:hypothetical protein